MMAGPSCPCHLLCSGCKQSSCSQNKGRHQLWGCFGPGLTAGQVCLSPNVLLSWPSLLPTPQVQNPGWLQQHCTLSSGHCSRGISCHSLVLPCWLALLTKAHQLLWLTPHPRVNLTKEARMTRKNSNCHMKKNYKLFFPPRTSPSQTWAKSQLNHYSKLPELQQGLGVTDTKRPCCPLTCYKRLRGTLSAHVLQCRVTFLIAKQVLSPSPDWQDVALTSNRLMGTDLGRMWHLWTWDRRVNPKWNPDCFNTTSKAGASGSTFVQQLDVQTLK